jgi:hypothetical protein
MMSQIKSVILFSAQMQHLKIRNLQTLSEAYDKNQTMLLQLVQFLARYMPDADAYSRLFPCLRDFVLKYRVPVEDAFLVLRRVIRHPRTAAPDGSALPAPVGTTGLGDGGAASPSPDPAASPSPATPFEGDMDVDGPPALPAHGAVDAKQLLAVCRDIVADEAVWAFLDPSLFLAFWDHTCSDIDVPHEFHLDPPRQEKFRVNWTR